MTLVAALVLAVVAFAVVAAPFFRQKPRLADAVTDEESQELYFKRDTTLSMLKELEFDHQSGILTDEDYQELDERYKRKGISILKEIDDMAKGSDEVEAMLEKRVSQIRRGKPANVEDEIEGRLKSLRKIKPAGQPDGIKEKASKVRQTRARFCPQCGASRQSNARFCAQCGTKLG